MCNLFGFTVRGENQTEILHWSEVLRISSPTRTVFFLCLDTVYTVYESTLDGQLQLLEVPGKDIGLIQIYKQNWIGPGQFFTDSRKAL